VSCTAKRHELFIGYLDLSDESSMMCYPRYIQKRCEGGRDGGLMRVDRKRMGDD
jgi:hypothetical protein